jgi:serine/threonine-protein kinase HipA
MSHDGRGYRLSPAFDLVPDVGDRHEHVLAFESARRVPDRDTMRVLAKRWHVRQADSIIDDVLRAMAQFGGTAKARGVPAVNVNEIGADIARRIARLTPR